MNSYVRVHFSSHSWMKSITSPTIPGNSFNVCRSSSELGTFSSLSSWPARILMLSVRLFIALWDPSWVLRCCQIYQSYHSHREQRRSSGMQYRCKKTQFSLQNSACSSQITGMCAFQGWFTSLTVFPIPITISMPSFVEPILGISGATTNSTNTPGHSFIVTHLFHWLFSNIGDTFEVV